VLGNNTFSGGATLGGSGLVAVNADSAGPAGAPTSGSLGTGTVNLAGAQIRAGTTASRTIGNNVTISADTTFATIASEKSLTFTGSILLSGGTRTLNVLTGSTVGTEKLTFSGAIGDGGNALGLTKTGNGTLVLSGSNTYTGNTTVTSGTLSFGTATLADTSTLSIASGAVLNLSHSATDDVGALVLGGTTQLSGTYSAANASPYITGSGSIRVSVGGSGYSSWASTNVGSQAANLDSDNDGVANGVEYFMGETGSGFTTNPGVVDGKVTWPKSASFSGTYLVETSLDLTTWTTVAATDNGTSVEYTLPTGVNRIFVRLKVTPN
jgi:autotransporter-associated beta strand protein